MAEVHEIDRPGDGPSRRGLVVRLTLALAVLALVAVGLVAAGSGRELASPAGTGAGAATGAYQAPLQLAVQPVPTAPPSTVPPLPLPEALPTNWYAPTEQVVLGTLEIPRFGVSEPLQEGITLTAINRGPGHWPGTPQPGELGNMVVAGHRTTYSRPFHRLDELVEGDQVIFTTDAGRFVYGVRGVIIVPEDHIGIAAQSRAHTATLFACHPKGQATHRIVAKLALLGPDGTFVDDEAALPPVDLGMDPVTGKNLQVRAAPDATGSPPPALTAES